MSNKYAIKYAAPNRNATVVLAVILLILMTGLFGQVAAQQRTSSRNSVNRFTQQGGKEAATVMFQGGRDLITDQQWAKAEEKFQQYTSTYPNEKNIDAALYWMAYSEFQLSKFELCKSTLTRLLNNYQSSSWKEDARTLLAQLPERYSGAAGSGTGIGTGVGVGTTIAQGPATEV